MAVGDVRTYEVTFCSRVSKWAEVLFSENPSWKFVRAEIEESVKRKRSDLRIYGVNNRLFLAGEVKLPGTPEGRNPYNSDLIGDAFQKASNLGAEFFFTWNVNKLVLFDSKKWNVPIMERRLNDYDSGLDLERPEDVSRPEVEKGIQAFLAKFFAQFHDIVEGIKADWAKPPDAYFISAFESHISWPVKLTREFIAEKSASDKTFDLHLQEWMSFDQGWQVIRNDQDGWRILIDRAARTLCYVFANRLLFYESVRRKFTDLDEIKIPKKVSASDELDVHFRKAFQDAVNETGDYETLFYPAEKDWAGALIFSHQFAAEAWRSVLGELHHFNFKEIRTDILGGIFQRLIAPEERHKFGQHYTNEDLVDVVNAFCIRRGEDVVFDPACGSGSFLVRAYLRAPNLYFQIMQRYADRFVPFGEIVTIRRGITSGCDAFFMPREVSKEFLIRYPRLEWNDAPLCTHCSRREVESGEIVLIRAGDDTVHPIEKEYLRPEVHSPMSITRPALSVTDLDRLVLFIAEPLEKLKGTYVLKYLRYGQNNAFTSTRSKAVPVPERSTCLARNPWYDLTHTKCGQIIWPKSQQYRHIIAHNRNRIIVNCNLYDVTVVDEKASPPEVLTAILNSTLVGLVKIYFGRYAGTEGNLKTEVVDVNLLEIPDPRDIPTSLAKKFTDAFARLCTRTIGGMVEEAFMECRSSERIKKLAGTPVQLPAELKMADRRDLDLAIFELLGVASANEREQLVDELYHETANHFRQVRIIEVQKQEQRAKSEGREFRTDELAADLWDSLHEDERQPLTAWLAKQVADGLSVNIPEGESRLPDASDFLEANTVFFRTPGTGKAAFKPLLLPSRAHAELVHFLRLQKIHGSVVLPKIEKTARNLLVVASARLTALKARAEELARSRSGDERKALDLSRLLVHWMTNGKPQRATGQP